MGGTGATAGAGTLYPGTGAQALSRGWSGKSKGRKLRQSQPAWNLGQVAESMGSSTPSWVSVPALPPHALSFYVTRSQDLSFLTC